MSELKGKTVAVFIEKFFDEREFIYPCIRMREAGATVIVAGTAAGKDYPGKSGYTERSAVSFADLDANKLDGIIIPGGYAPDMMRRSKECIELVKKMNEQKKLIAFICHGGWLPISANILRGVKATAFSAIKDDMVNAGVIWEDAPVVQDGHIITSRTPEDLPQFMKAIIKFMA